MYRTTRKTVSFVIIFVVVLAALVFLAWGSKGFREWDASKWFDYWGKGAPAAVKPADKPTEKDPTDPASEEKDSTDQTEPTSVAEAPAGARIVGAKHAGISFDSVDATFATTMSQYNLKNLQVGMLKYSEDTGKRDLGITYASSISGVTELTYDFAVYSAETTNFDESNFETPLKTFQKTAVFLGSGGTYRTFDYGAIVVLSGISFSSFDKTKSYSLFATRGFSVIISNSYFTEDLELDPGVYCISVKILGQGNYVDSAACSFLYRVVEASAFDITTEIDGTTLSAVFPGTFQVCEYGGQLNDMNFYEFDVVTFANGSSYDDSVDYKFSFISSYLHGSGLTASSELYQYFNGFDPTVTGIGPFSVIDSNGVKLTNSNCNEKHTGAEFSIDLSKLFFVEKFLGVCQVKFSPYSAIHYSKYYGTTEDNTSVFSVLSPYEDVTVNFEIGRLATPTNLVCENYLLTWDAVPGATGYAVFEGDRTWTLDADTTSFNIKTALTEKADYTFRIRALGNVGKQFAEGSGAVATVSAFNAAANITQLVSVTYKVEDESFVKFVPFDAVLTDYLYDVEVPGKVFSGWYYDSGFSRPVEDADKLSADTTVYARLTDKPIEKNKAVDSWWSRNMWYVIVPCAVVLVCGIYAAVLVIRKKRGN